MRQIAAFDFDGTLTKGDTFIPFIKFSLGRFRLYLALFKNIPWLMLYAMRLYPNWKAKRRLFTTCFAGWNIKEFQSKALLFAQKNRSLLRANTEEVLISFLNAGVKVYIITASMETWVKPFFSNYPSITYLSTLPEVKGEVLTGSFASPNCYGKEKVRRLLAIEPQRESYFLFVFGDSQGDKDLLALSDKGFYRQLVKYEES